MWRVYAVHTLKIVHAGKLADVTNDKFKMTRSSNRGNMVDFIEKIWWSSNGGNVMADKGGNWSGDEIGFTL